MPLCSVPLESTAPSLDVSPALQACMAAPLASCLPRARGPVPRGTHAWRGPQAPRRPCVLLDSTACREQSRAPAVPRAPTVQRQGSHQRAAPATAPRGTRVPPVVSRPRQACVQPGSTAALDPQPAPCVPPSFVVRQAQAPQPPVRGRGSCAHLARAPTPLRPSPPPASPAALRLQPGPATSRTTLW